MKISIAMATYNGAKYLAEQLESFASQTRKPDELVVCDDGSTDTTLEILEDFRKRVPFNVQIHRNILNLGYIKNFEKALTLCTGDIIFLSDQDDVWFNEKLETIEKIFIENAKAMIVINDQILTDTNLKSTGLTVFSNTKSLGFGNDWICAGCSTTIKSEFLSVILPFPFELMPHDSWIHQIANLLKCRFVVNMPLQIYRRHGSNVSESIACGLVKPNKYLALNQFNNEELLNNLIKEIEILKYIEITLINKRNELECLGLLEESLLAIKYVEKKISAIDGRFRILKMSFFKRTIKIIGFYCTGNYKYFSGYKTFAKDIVYQSLGSK